MYYFKLVNCDENNYPVKTVQKLIN